MFGIKYFKASPTDYVFRYRNGELVKNGRGLSFFYFAPNSIIGLVPAGSVDVPFVFEEATADFQQVTIQGEITYQIADPEKAANLLDFTVDPNQRYRSDDPSKLDERLTHAVQILMRSFTQNNPLKEVLVSSDALVTNALKGLKTSEVVRMLGLEILAVSIVSIKASPEMAKALQADAREALLRQADEAVFERRNAAVEQERKIKENELNTDIAVEAKRRKVRETKLAADIAVEEERVKLVERRTANQRKEAEARGDALRSTLAPFKEMDWRTLIAASGNLKARDLIAMAFRDLADNAGKIGKLSISPDLLESLLDDDESASEGKNKRNTQYR